MRWVVKPIFSEKHFISKKDKLKSKTSNVINVVPILKAFTSKHEESKGRARMIFVI